MTATDLLFLVGAGLLAGVVNALAGGGTLVSFPALLALGLPGLTATVTNAVALWPGYVGGAVGYRKELRGQRSRTTSLSVTAVLGACVGSSLLLLTPGKLFESMVPWLVAFASLALLAQPWLRRLFGGEADEPVSRLVYAGVFLGGCYGAYFITAAPPAAPAPWACRDRAAHPRATRSGDPVFRTPSRSLGWTHCKT
ncbi:sulfite exporter TauE/SafE family protein [Nonomuraea fuscirosea]